MRFPGRNRRSERVSPARKSLRRRLWARRPRIKGNTWVLLLILALLGTATWILTPSGSTALDRETTNLGMRLGLDLQGGSHLVYQVEFDEEWGEGERGFYLEMAVTTIRDRIDKYGVAEPVIQQQGDDRILVQLPGITDIDEAKSLIEETGFLEFREVEVDGDGNVITLQDYLDDQERTEFFDATVEGKRVFAIADTSGDSVETVTVPYYLENTEEGLVFVDGDGNAVDVDPDSLSDTEKTAYSWVPSRGILTKTIDGVETDVAEQLTGLYLSEALPYYPTSEELLQGAEICVMIEWDSEGTELFDEVTKRLRDRSTYGDPDRALGIFLDDEMISSPQVFPTSMTDDSYGSSATITGNFNWEEAKLLAIQLDSGALPMPLEQPPLYESEVSATLGKDFINKAFLAGLIGVAVIMLFMMLHYRLPGVVASLALLVYVALVLAIFKLIPVTLTLAGLAGFILSIGMAVDANVLIFERLKEELRAGKTLKAATETGFNRAWVAIRDSNISTFIICGVLYWFGSSIVDSPQVMGFAVTLFFGVAISMFTAIVVTRTLLRFAVRPRMARRLRLFGVEAPANV